MMNIVTKEHALFYDFAKRVIIFHSIFTVAGRMSIVAPAVDNGQVRSHRENS